MHLRIEFFKGSWGRHFKNLRVPKVKPLEAIPGIEGFNTRTHPFTQRTLSVGEYFDFSGIVH
jgi:hypothetical protein